MAMRGDAKVFEPFVGLITVGMHSAVDDDGGKAVSVRFDDALGPGGVGDACEAFVVDDDVETLPPIRVLIERDLGVGRGAALVDDRPVDGQGCECRNACFADRLR